MPDGVLIADGLAGALLGVGTRCGQCDVAVYSVRKVLDILRTRDGMSQDDAREFFDFNIGGAWWGAGTPVWLEESDREVVKEIIKRNDL